MGQIIGEMGVGETGTNLIITDFGGVCTCILSREAYELCGPH